MLWFSTAFADIDQRTKSWTNMDITGAVFNSDRWVYDLFSQARYNFAPGQYEQSRIEPALGYKITPNISLWLGDSVIIPNANNVIRSNRIWQQLLWNVIPNNPVTIISRTRLEERQNYAEPQWSYVLRERLMVILPQIPTTPFAPVAFDELFVNLNHPNWVNSQVINENRIFAGVRILFKKTVSLDVGYLNQYVCSATTNQDNPVVYVNLNITT